LGSGLGEEQGRAVRLDAEGLDGRLGGRGDEEVLEGTAARDVDAGGPHGVGAQDVVDVRERGVALEHDAELDSLLERQVGAAVRQRVGALLRRDRQRGAHALAALDVPVATRHDARGLPEGLLLQVGSGAVAAGDEARARPGDLAERARRAPGGSPADPGGVGGWPHEHEVVVHDEPTVDQDARAEVLPLERRRVNQDYVRVAVGAELEGGAGADGDGPHRVAGPPLEQGNQHVEQARVLRAGRRGQDDGPLSGAVAGGGRQQPEP